ncbi:MAG: transcriptional regulator [Pseudomonas sp.]|jgi:hypothetical protein|nr:transcriptional regulator [Pseudomonas sp.]
MSKLAEYRQLERHLAEQLEALEAMKGDKALEQEIEFESKLRELLGEYNKSLKDIVSILDPQSSSRSGKTAPAPAKATRKARSVKQYKNPHSGEVVETKGGNHKTLKQWKAEYGAETVESWVA